jgi:predicted PurR-regulated permease PerM
VKERLIRERLFFFLMVIGLVILTWALVWPFVTSILLAFAVVVIMKPLYNRFLVARWVKGNEKRATGATIVVFILVIAVPTFLIVGAAVSQAASLFSGLDIDGADFSLPSIIAWLEETIQEVGAGNIQLDEVQIAEKVQAAIHSVGAWLGELAVALGESIPKFLTSALIVLVLMAVLLPRYNRPGRQDIVELVPFPKEITQLYLDKINLMILAMFKGTFVIAIVQGGAMGVVLWIAGVPYTTFLTLLSMFLSLVPLIGISLIAWPAGIILMLTGQVWQGIFVIVAFLLVVANIDTVLRPRLVSKGAYLNPALVILSVLGGLQLMGIIGALYGPVIMILLVTSIEVYTKYILRSDLEVLLGQDELDLEELGIVPEEDEEKKDESGVLMTTVKNLVARFQKGSNDQEREQTAV